MARQLKNEYGGTLVLYTVAMVAMMGMAALAIDLGMLRKAKAEAQRAADAAALAGASAFLLDQSRAQESTEAVRRARTLADTNYMNGVKFDSTAEVAVQVIYDSVKVRVTVRRASVPTWFARVFGLNSFPVGAKAAAVADFATGTNCVKPLAIADWWDESNDANGNHLPDPGEDWLGYTNPPDTYHQAHYAGDGTGTGLGSSFRDPVLRDWGMPIMLRPAGQADADDVCPGSLQGGKCYRPGWWGLWEATGSPGANQIRWAFDNCVATHTIGATEMVEPGWKTGPVEKGVEGRWDGDPTAQWNPNQVDTQTGKQGTVTGSDLVANWRASERVWIIAMFSPDYPIPNGRKPIIFNNFGLFFFEGCTEEDNPQPSDFSGQCTNKTTMYGRFLGYANGTASGGPTPGTMVRILRLVE